MFPTDQTSLTRHHWPLTSPGVIAAVTMGLASPRHHRPDIIKTTTLDPGPYSPAPTQTIDQTAIPWL